MARYLLTNPMNQHSREECQVVKQLLAAAAFVAGMTVAGIASAAPQLQLSLDDGSGNSALLIDVAATGLLSLNGPFGNWTVNVTTGTGFPVTGTLQEPVIDLNSVNVATGSGGQLVIKLTQIGLTSSTATGPFLAELGGTITSQSVGASLEYKAYVDSTNAVFGTQTLIGESTFGAGAFAFSQSTVAPTGPLYSMTEIVTLRAPSGTAGGTNVAFSFDGSLGYESSVPEPGTLALLGLGLAGLAATRRRKQ